MAQFDVCRLRGGGLVVDCQSPLLESLPTRFVVPLRKVEEPPMDRLNPVFHVEDVKYQLVTQLAGAVDRRSIQQTVTSLATHDLTIKSALDMLISGF